MTCVGKLIGYSQVDSCPNSPLSADADGNTLHTLELSVKTQASGLDVLYVSLMERSESREWHTRYLEMGRFTGAARRLGLSASRTLEAATFAEGTAEGASSTAVEEIDAPLAPTASATTPAASAPLAPTASATTPAATPSAPLAPTASAATPVHEHSLSSISILSPQDIEQIMLNRRTVDSKGTWTRLKANKNLDTIMASLLDRKHELWTVRLCLVVVQSPHDSLLCKVHSSLGGQYSSTAMQQAVLNLPLRPMTGHSAAHKFASLAKRLPEMPTLQESLDLAANFSNVASSGKLSKTLVPRLQQGTLQLSTRSDRAVLQAGIQRNMELGECVLMMKTRKVRSAPSEPVRKKQALDPVVSSEDVGVSQEYVGAEVDDAMISGSPDIHSFETPLSSSVSLTVNISADSDRYVQYKKLLEREGGLVPLIWNEDDKVTCMPMAAILAYDTCLRFNGGYCFQQIDAFQNLACSCGDNRPPYLHGYTTCMHLFILETLVATHDPFPFAGLSTATTLPATDKAGRIVVRLAQGSREHFAVVIRTSFDEPDVAVVRVAGDHVTCSRASCGDRGRKTLASVHSISSCVHILALTAHEVWATSHSPADPVHVGEDAPHMEEYGVQQEEEEVADEGFDVAKGEYFFPSFSKYTPMDAFTFRLVHGKYPEKFAASFGAVETVGDSEPSSVTINGRKLVGYKGLGLAPPHASTCACGGTLHRLIDRECVVYTATAPFIHTVYKLVCESPACLPEVYSGESDFVWFQSESLGFHAGLFYSFLMAPLQSRVACTFSSFCGTTAEQYAQRNEQFRFVSPETYMKGWFSFFAAHKFQYIQGCAGCSAEGRSPFHVRNLGFDGLNQGPRKTHHIGDISSPSPDSNVIYDRVSQRDERTPLPALPASQSKKDWGVAVKEVLAAREFFEQVAKRLSGAVPSEGNLVIGEQLEGYFARLDAQHGTGLRAFVEDMLQLTPGSSQARLFAPLCGLIAEANAVDGLIPLKRRDTVSACLAELASASFSPQEQGARIMEALNGTCIEVARIIRQLGPLSSAKCYLFFVCERIRHVREKQAASSQHPPWEAIPNTLNPLVRGGHYMGG